MGDLLSEGECASREVEHHVVNIPAIRGPPLHVEVHLRATSTSAEGGRGKAQEAEGERRRVGGGGRWEVEGGGRERDGREWSRACE